MPHGRLGKRRRSSPRAPTKTPTILVGLKENKWFYFHIEIRKYVANATLKIVFVTKNLKGVKLIRKLTMIFLLLFLLREFPRYFERNFPRLLILLTPTRSSNIWPLEWLSLTSFYTRTQKCLVIHQGTQIWQVWQTTQLLCVSKTSIKCQL